MEWTKDPTSTPKVVNLARLFSPQSFLTAIKEVCSQQHHLELNKLNVLTTVTKKDVASIDAPAREGQLCATHAQRCPVFQQLIPLTKAPAAFQHMRACGLCICREVLEPTV